MLSLRTFVTLQWRHNESDGVSNHRRLDSLLNSLFSCRSKKNIKALRHCPLSGEFTGDRWKIATNRLDKNRPKQNIPYVYCRDADDSACVYSFEICLQLDAKYYVRQHIEAETRLPPFLRRPLPMHFLEWKCINFAYDFTEVSSYGSN